MAIIISSLMKLPIDSSRYTAFIYILKYLIPEFRRPGTGIAPWVGPRRAIGALHRHDGRRMTP